MVSATDSVQIDWSGDGTFTGTGEDVSSRVRASGFSSSRGRDQIRMLTPPAAGAAEFELDNRSKDYSPGHSASPIYGLVQPGKIARIRTTFQATTYPRFKGILRIPEQHPELDRLSVTFPCLGTLSKLVALKQVSTALYTNVRTDQCLAVLFALAGITDYVLDTGKTTLAYWWVDQGDGWDEALALVYSEGPGAALYEDGQGRPVFESRHYRLLTSRCTAVQATFRSAGAEPLFSAPFSFDPGLKDIINQVTLSHKTRTVQALSVVWSLGSTVTLAPNESRQYVANNSNPFTAAVVPVAATDYTVSAGSLSSVTLDRTSGARVTITLTAGASGATVTGLQLRAQLVTVSASTDVPQTVDVTTSQARHGVRPLPSSYQPRAELDSINVMQDLANAIASAYKDPRPTASVDVNNGDATRFAAVLAREVSDRVRVVESVTETDAEVFVERIADRQSDGGLKHTITLGCEQADSSLFLVLDSATNGLLDVNRLGF